MRMRPGTDKSPEDICSGVVLYSREGWHGWLVSMVAAECVYE